MPFYSKTQCFRAIPLLVLLLLLIATDDIQGNTNILRNKVRRYCGDHFKHIVNGGVLASINSGATPVSNSTEISCLVHTGENGFCSKKTCLMYDPSLLTPLYYNTICLSETSSPVEGSPLNAQKYSCMSLQKSTTTYQFVANCQGLAIYRLAPERRPYECRPILHVGRPDDWEEYME